jgi:hypothetical protein
MTNMEQLLSGVLLGAILLATVLFLIGAAKWVKKTNRQLQVLSDGVVRLAEVFEKSSDMTTSMISLTAVVKRLISSTESMTAAVKTFASLLIQPSAASEPAEDIGLGFPSRIPPMPPHPEYEQFAREEDSGVISQTDDEMADLDRQSELRKQGIETSPDLIPIPQAGQVNFVES